MRRDAGARHVVRQQQHVDDQERQSQHLSQSSTLHCDDVVDDVICWRDLLRKLSIRGWGRVTALDQSGS